MTRTFNEIITDINTVRNTPGKTEEQLMELHSLAWELQLKCEKFLR